jgi:two-component system chemotaxis response regulator CheY
MQVLIVDDSELRLSQLRQILEESGHVVIGMARDGAEALEQYRALRPDIVIMDLIMPRMNGLDALRAILRRDPAANVVIASSMRSPESALECQRNGARFYLHKPYDAQLVKSVVNRLAEELGGGRGEVARAATHEPPP